MQVTYDSNAILEGTNNYVGPQLLHILNSCLSWLPHAAEKCGSYESYLELTLSSRCQVIEETSFSHLIVA